MIDKVLGFDQPAPIRRRKQDTTSQTYSNHQQRSSKKQLSVKEASEPVSVKPSPTKSFARKPTEEQVSVEEAQVQSPPVQESFKSPKPKKQLRQEKADKKHSSDEEIASPAVRNLGFAKVAKAPQQMRSSLKLSMSESIRVAQSQKSDDTMYKLKMLAFLIFSFFMMIYAMTPARKGQRRK